MRGVLMNCLQILYLQFSRLANLYTLAIVLMCLFPFSPVSPASSVLPLAFVVSILIILFLFFSFPSFPSSFPLCFLPFLPLPLFSFTCIKLATSALKEFMEDLKRHKADNEVNNRETFVFGKLTKSGHYQIGDDAQFGFTARPWKEVKVGDIVKVNNNQRLPADLVLLSTSRYLEGEDEEKGKM